MGGDYVVFLMRADVDRFGHHRLFVDELAPCFAACGLAVREVDYIAQPRAVFDALRDADCRFFFCFNGFGAEIKMATRDPGVLVSAFPQFGKPVVDLMHDCPAHLTMAHQAEAVTAQRYLFCTDYRYAEIAGAMGMAQVDHCGSIAFPRGARPKPHGARGIDILLASGFSAPCGFRSRDLVSAGRRAVYGGMFDQVAARCEADWEVDPILELALAFQGAGLAVDYRAAEYRLLLTDLVDHVKFARRHALLAVVSDYPVTVVSDRPLPGAKVAVRASMSSAELLAVMGDARIVLCPTAHHTGYHERPLGAFSSAAAVVAGPGKAMERHFVAGREAMFYRDARSVRGGIEALLDDPGRAEAMGQAGRQRALAEFDPQVFAERIVATVARRRQ